MQFITKNDLYGCIEQTDLDLLLDGNNTALTFSISTAISEVKSRIRNRYDVDKIFVNVPYWYSTETYNNGQYAKLVADVYDSENSYDVGDYVFEDLFVYKSLVTLNDDNLPSTNPSKWKFIGNMNGIYKCLVDNTISTDISDQSTWKEFSDYDLLKKYVIYICIHDLYSRIVPKNIPEAVTQRWLKSIEDLNKIGCGNEMMLDLPIYTDTSKGQRISYGSNVKNNLIY